MEVAGLTIGAVALVSLFKDCVDLLSMITAARDLGKDAAIMNTKLDVEKMLFLQWSDRVGLLKQGSASTNALLCSPDNRQIVSRVLESIKALLSEGQALQRDYGLKRVEKVGTEPTAGYQGASSFRFAKFLKQFEELNIKPCQTSDADQHSNFKKFTKQFRWIIVDKDKFNSLIDHLSYFNTSLNNLIPMPSVSETTFSKNELIHLKNLAELDLVIEATSNTRPSISEAAVAAKSALISSRVIRSLWFRWYDERRVNIKSPHFKTLQWALDPPSDYLQWDDLNTWLQSASGIYWLSGKAGSGKSTLMKYLHENAKTHALLQTWANGSKLILANFFFYALGKSEQKSQSGLLRSLLYQMLEYDPSVTEHALPHMWREARYNHQGSPELEIPSIEEMATALKVLCSTLHADRKIFFLIDGIDEYEGKDLDIARFIGELESFPNVKILVSGRPHPAFMTAFRQKPKMNLQDLTKRDVATYIQDTVSYHPYMRSLSHQSQYQVDKITEKLAQKASGVFLWVILACRAVVEGCDDFCTMTELEARVDELPKELEDIIEHMLENIDPRWKQDAMRLIHLIYTNEGCQGFDPIPTLGLHLTHEKGLKGDTSLSGISPEEITLSEMEAQCRVMEGRLRSRCCGLLEVHYGHRDETNIEDCIVKFMHRTVYDMLLQPEIASRLFRELERENFDSYAVLSEIWCRMATTPSDSDDIFFNALYPLVLRDAEGQPPAVTLHLLSRLQFVFGQLSLSPWLGAPRYLQHDQKCRRYCNDFSLAFTLAIEMGMDNVVRFVLESKISLKSLLFRHPSLAFLRDCQPTRRLKNSHLFSCQKDGKLLQTTYPLLYHAIVQPFRSDYFAYDRNIRQKASLSLTRLIIDVQTDSDEGARLSLQGLENTNGGKLLQEIDGLVSFDGDEKEGWEEVKKFCEQQLNSEISM
ncbi:related to small s protein [Fusarium fujikuroi]|nr:related to small s protein [Fusarium fujikuroi]